MRLATPLLTSALFFTGAALHAHGDTYGFVFSGPGTDSVSFSLPSEFHSTTGGNAIGIDFSNVPVDLNGTVSLRPVGFFVPINDGGFALESSTHAYGFEGPQVFTAQLYVPYSNNPQLSYYKDATFNLGTYILNETNGDHLGVGTLVISDLSSPTASTVPEPSTLTLLGSGVLVAAGAMRRRFHCA